MMVEKNVQAIGASCCPEIVTASLRLLSEMSKTPRHLARISEAKDILFENFQGPWLKVNFKFDVSFSSAPSLAPSKLRFSYNNFGENELFYLKIFEIFNLYPGAYDEIALRRLLDVMKPTVQSHQTTIGFEWVTEEDSPRIKIYFEELIHRYSALQVAQFAHSIARIIGDPEIDVPKGTIGAIAVDFFAGGKKSIKFYVLFQSLDGVFERMPVEFKPIGNCVRRKMIETFSLETKAFYYLTHRLLNGKTISAKIYKVYEFAQFRSAAPAMREIKVLLARWGNVESIRHISRLADLCRRYEYLLCPVIASVDLLQEEVRSVDTYFSCAGFRNLKNSGPYISSS
ncbi:MAG: hypothetical protein ACYCPQ_10160 [Elusimicrobiota bacterium]